MLSKRIAAWLPGTVLSCTAAIPVWIAANSPLLISREPVYIVGGLAGVLALVLLMLQPLLAAGYLPGVGRTQARLWHPRLGGALVAMVALHVVGLYLTSPPDMLDALLLRAPTLYSLYGVIGMWGLILIVALVAARSRLQRRVQLWRIIHNLLAVLVVMASVAHAVMIEGTMGAISKYVLCACVLVITVVVTIRMRFIRRGAQVS